MKKIVLALMVIILLGLVTTYIVKINEEYPPSMITMNPPSEFLKYELVDKNLETYAYRNQDIINQLHKIIITKSGRRLRHEDDFDEVVKFEYGYKGVSARIDGEGRVVVPIRIIDLKEQSTIDYIVWKIYQVINKGYFVYYISEPDEEMLKLVEQIEFTMIDE